MSMFSGERRFLRGELICQTIEKASSEGQNVVGIDEN